jgi:hypothetical protein
MRGPPIWNLLWLTHPFLPAAAEGGLEGSDPIIRDQAVLAAGGF